MMRSVADEPTPQPTDSPATATAEAEELSAFQRAQKTYALVSDILTPQRVGLFLAFALLLGIGLFGGWDAAVTEVDDVPRGEPGVAATVAPFRVEVRRARYGASLAPAFPARDGVRYWFVTVDVTNTSGRPVAKALLTEDATLDLPGLQAAWSSERAIPTAHRLADGLVQEHYQPGLTTRIVLVWQQDNAEPLPDDVTLTLASHTWRASSLDGGLDWRDATPGLVVTLPAEPLQEA